MLRAVLGLTTPVIFKVTYEDRSTEEIRIPAEVWRRKPDGFARFLIRDKEIAAVEVDPHRETADVDTANNYWPRRIEDKRIELYEYDRERRNLMKDMDVPLKSGDDDN